MASPGNPPFDMNKLFRPSVMGMGPPSPIPSPTVSGNLATSPTFPAQPSAPPPPPYLAPSSSFPPPSATYPFHYMAYPPPPSPANPTSGSDLLLAFFGNQNQCQGLNAAPSAPPLRSPSSKLPRGRHVFGNEVVYDIDVRLQGEVQPQLEVTPITKYASDPGLVLGRQIAVNRNYICYGLKLGNIRILNINTALRSLLRGHTQRVTDMAFFAEDVHLLASASVDGRVFVWKINEGPDEEDKPQIFGQVINALQIIGQGQPVHPRVCWHPHKQEILMVAVGNRILKIDTMKVAKLEGFSAEEPLNCPVDKLIDGVQFVGKHDGEITELSMCQWLTTRLASASIDGTVKVWDDRKSVPLAVLRPHDGHPVYSATFLTAPNRPDHIVLITGGPLNREIKIWVSTSEEGWLLPSDAESWQWSQSLELKSSFESKMEDAFFNQVVVLSRAGLFLLANAKRNAIYAMHIDFGPNPAATHMDYIAEFTVTMPILSLTGTSDSLPDGEHVVQVYCVQTQAIQQYALDLSHCLPSPLENVELEKSNSNLARAFEATNADASAVTEIFQSSRLNEISGGSSITVMPAQSLGMEDASTGSQQEKLAFSEATSLTEVTKSGPGNKPNSSTSQKSSDNLYGASPQLPMSPKLSQKSSGFRSPSKADQVSDHAACDFTVDHKFDGAKENKMDVAPASENLGKTDSNVSQSDISMVPDPPLVFKHPTHLVTPSEILSTVNSSSESTHINSISAVETNVQDVGVSNDMESAEVEVKVVGEAGSVGNYTPEYIKDPHITTSEKKEKTFYSQASDLGFQMTGDLHRETYGTERAQEVNDVRFVDSIDKPINEADGKNQGLMENVVAKSRESEAVNDMPASAVKGRKQKGRNTQISGPSSSSPSPYNSTDSSNEPGCSSAAPSSDAALPHLLAMQDTLVQLMSMQKELQKQMNAIVTAPVNREGKRLEASLGKYIEKVVTANEDALWARFQEENAKREKLERDRTQQITSLIVNYINKDLPAIFERSLKKEISAIGPILARAITPIMEKSISSAISESFQKGVGEKAVNQLEKSVSSKLDATIARQIQAQFQISGRHALQDALRSSLETSIIPAFEISCKTMFEQIDTAFQKGISKHTAAAQQQSEDAHSTLAVALRDAINSLTSVAQTVSGELADGQRKLLAIAASSANSKDGNVLVKNLSNGPLAVLHEMPQIHMDPMKELSRLIAERKYDEAFTVALHRNDVSIVSRLCSQVDLHGILSTVPLPLTQGVLLALLQQLACDISNETSKKISWMTDVAVAINPSDPIFTLHIKPIFEQVYQILGHQQSLSTSPAEASSFRILMHVVHSVSASCK